MNYMLLEGIAFYVFLVIILLLMMICMACLISAILADKKNFLLRGELKEEQEKTKELSKENFKLKLLCGVLEIDE